MAKVAFSKLNLKKDDSVSVFECADNIKIEVKNYLPINEKMDLISRVVNACGSNEYNFMNPVQIEVVSSLEIIMAYTNLSFTDKQKEDISKLYDLLKSNYLIDQILLEIPEEEYKFIRQGIDETIKSIYSYRNSALGIFESISTDYNNLNLEASDIQKVLTDPNSMTLLKDVLSKMG